MSASLAPECNEVKERYDNCFLKWYSESKQDRFPHLNPNKSDKRYIEFIRGSATSDECDPLFKQYEKCLSKALQDRGIDKMLKEAREDNRENDAEHMRPCGHYVDYTWAPGFLGSPFGLTLFLQFILPFTMSIPTSRLGIHLAPATAAWAAPFAAYYIFLQNRVVYHRITSRTAMGDKIDPTKGNDDPLYVASRAQVNFNENVPLLLVVSLLAELNGVPRKYINYALATLFTFRVAHAEFGLMRPKSLGTGRGVGFYGTQVLLATVAGYATYFVKDYWM
ncbi:unnamed protein product [Periconia digitata]|uniref:Uncharacterized protein n=1 Tax=Periconia digitata TaxID=1303443 RepID=A0A9W4XV58_9PLEO|nr:unnamed protein product [Periconia digitata]